MFFRTMGVLSVALLACIIGVASTDIYLHALTATPGMEGWQAVILHATMHAASYFLGMIGMAGLIHWAKA